MSLSVKLLWKMFSSSPQGENISAGDKTSLFEVRTGKNLLREIGGNIQPTFFPLVLEPTTDFFPKLLATARTLNVKGSKNLFNIPLTILPSGLEVEVLVKFSTHVYGRQICLNIETASFDVPSGTDFLRLQDFSSHNSLLVLAKRIFEIFFHEEKHVSLSALGLKFYPCIQIVCSQTSELSLQDLIRTLTRHPGANDHLINSVLAKNRVHQVDNTLTLLDRQGLLSYVPSNVSPEELAGNNRRFRSAHSMIELAAAVQRVLKDSPDEKTRGRISSLVNRLPRDTIPNSTSAQYAWGLLLDEFNLLSIFSSLSPPNIDRSPKVEKEALQETEQLPRPSEQGILGELSRERTILCVAAATIELSAIQIYLASKFGAPSPVALSGGDDYALQFQDSESQTIWNVVTLSFQGASEAALEVRHLSHLVKPHIILMVGMCMGMPKRDYPVGTVVVPNEVYAFDHERLTASGTQVRPHGDRVDNGIYKLARILGVSQKLSYQVITDKGLASASRKVEDADSSLIKFIEATFPDVAAYDMEGWGFYRAGSGQQCLWIKSVADSGDAPEPDAAGQTKKLSIQTKATDTAIDFAILLVRTYFFLREKSN